MNQYSLYGQRISETYPRLLQITSGDTVLDGSGDTRSLYVNGNFSADTIFIGSADLNNIFAPIGAIGSGATTFIRNGLNTYTGGTLTSPTVNVSAATLSYLSATTISGDTIYSGGTNLYQIFSTIGSGDIVRVQPGSNIITAGTVNAPIIGVVESPSFNNLTLSGLGQFNSVSASSFSATSFYSGNTNLYSIFATIGSSGPSTFVQPGLNTYTGGTNEAPTVNVSAATLAYLSATTISGGTFYSGGTSLETIITNLSVGGSSTYVQPGLNTYTGGTSSAPTISVSAATLHYLSATTISGSSLDVQGPFKYVDGNQGATKVLTSDAFGNATWQEIPALGIGTFMFVSGASDIATYKQMVPLNLYVSDGLIQDTTSVNTTPTLIGGFATNGGYPGVTFIPLGNFLAHFETKKASGANNYYSFYEVYKYSSGGSESYLFSSDTSTITASNQVIQNTLYSHVTSGITLEQTDRIIVKIFSVMLSSSANITLQYDNNTGASFIMPTSSVDTTHLVPYTGATSNVDLGSYNITANQISGSVLLSGNTNLDQIFATTGATYLPTNQIAFGSSNSGITGSSLFTYSGGYLKVGDGYASPIAIHSNGSEGFITSQSMNVQGVNGLALYGGVRTVIGGNSVYNTRVDAVGLKVSPGENLFGGVNTYSFEVSGTTKLESVTAITINSNSVSATTLSAGTIYSGTTNLYDIFATTGSTYLPATQVAFGSYNSGLTGSSRLTFVGTGNTSTLSVFSPNLSNYARLYADDADAYLFGGSGNLNISGANLRIIGSGAQTTIQSSVATAINLITNGQSRLFVEGTSGVVRANEFSATTLSAGTYYSGSTPLETIITNLSVGGTSTYVQPGLNTYTGGTSSAPTVNISAATLSYLSATTVSANTAYLLNMQPNQVAFVHPSTSGLTGDTWFKFHPNTVGGGYGQIGYINIGYGVAYGGYFGIDMSAFGTSRISSQLSLIEFDRITSFGNVSIIVQNRRALRGDYSGVTFGPSLETESTARVDITSGTSIIPQLRVRSGQTYSGSYLDGSIWNDGSHLYGMFGGEVRVLDSGSTGNGSSTYVQPGLNTYTGGTSSAPTVNISAATLSYLSATTISGDTIYSGATNLSTTIINIANASAAATGDFTRVQGSNFITTGGTANAPIINLAQNFSGATVSGGTFYSGSTNLETIFRNIEDITRVQPGSNISTGGTDNYPVISIVSSPSLNGLTLSGIGQFAVVTATSFSGGTVSGGTLFSGSTNLYDIFAGVGTVGGASTFVQPGFNTYTGGTSSAPTVNISAATLVTLSGGTVSGGTFYSGSTPLETIITNLAVGGTSTYVQPGFNTYTGGTSSAPTVNISAATLVTISGGTISGGTLYSGSTNLNDVFHRKSGYLLQKAGLLSGSTFTGSPRKSSVTFTTPFANNLYSIAVTGEINRTWSIESRTASGFTISSNSTTAFSSSVFWNCCEIGEGYR